MARAAAGVPARHHTPPASGRIRAGFTLIELLVVIAIIAIPTNRYFSARVADKDPPNLPTGG